MNKTPLVLTPFMLICLTGFAAFFSSYLRIPVMPLLAASLGADPAQIGTINGAFMLTTGLLSIPAGLLADRTGRKLPIILGISASAISSLLVTRCQQPGQMVAAYILFGAGLASFAPVMLSLVADVVPVERLGRAYGWYTTAIYVAMTLGPATGGFIAKTLGLRQVFAVSGALLTLTAFLALLMLPRNPAQHRSDPQSALAQGAELLRNSSLRACLTATVGSCIGFGVFLTFLPLYAAHLGYDPARTGMIFAAQAITNVFGRVPIGRLADRFERSGLVALGLLCFAAGLILLGVVAEFGMVLMCAVIMGAGMALTFTAIGALIADVVPAVQRGLAMGMYNSCIYLGLMCGSTVMGIFLQQTGYPLGFAAAGGAVIGALALFLGMMQGKQKR